MIITQASFVKSAYDSYINDRLLFKNKIIILKSNLNINKVKKTFIYFYKIYKHIRKTIRSKKIIHIEDSKKVFIFIDENNTKYTISKESHGSAYINNMFYSLIGYNKNLIL